MTINWLILNNETLVVLRRSTKFQNYSTLYFFFDYRIMVGSVCKAVVPGVCRNTCFRQYGDYSAYIISLSQLVKIKQSKKLKLWNVMPNDAKLTWGRSYYCKTVSNCWVKFGRPYQNFLDPPWVVTIQVVIISNPSCSNNNKLISSRFRCKKGNRIQIS